MDIRSEFWSAVDRSATKKAVKKQKTSKIITLSNESAHYYDIITNENLYNEIDAEIMYHMTKKSKIKSFTDVESEEDLELRRIEWRKRNKMMENTAFTPTAAASSGAGSGGGSKRLEESLYVVSGYVESGYVE